MKLPTINVQGCALGHARLNLFKYAANTAEMQGYTDSALFAKKIAGDAINQSLFKGAQICLAHRVAATGDVHKAVQEINATLNRTRQ